MIIKKKIHLFLKQLLITKKNQILKNFYSVKLIKLRQYWKYFKPYFYFKHLFPNILWAKLLYIYNNFIRYRTSKDRRENKRNYKIRLKKKKIWYLPLDFNFYKRKRWDDNFFHWYRFFLLWDCKDIDTGLDYKYYINKMLRYFNTIYSKQIQIMKLLHILRGSLIKISMKNKRIIRTLKILNNIIILKRSFYKKVFFNVKSKLLMCEYIKFSKIAYWQNSTYLILRNWLTPRKHWAWLDYTTVYKKPIKQISILNKRIALIKSIYLFWGFFNFLVKNPFSILVVRTKFLKFKNFCNVYRMNFFSIWMLRIGSILLNTNFVSNVYYMRHLIDHGCFLLNKIQIQSVNIICKKWDIITINILYKYFIFKTFLDKFKFITRPITFMLKGGFWISKYNKDIYSWNKRIFNNAPRYLQLDFLLLFIIIISTKITFKHIKSLFSLHTNKYNVSNKKFLWFKF